MTAMTRERAPKTWNNSPLAAHYSALPLAAGAKILAGSLVFLLASGYLSQTPAADALCLGIAPETKDNTDGAAGALSLAPARGCPALSNSSSVDAVTAADVGRLVYVADNQTIARTSSAGTRCVAGRLVSFEGSVPYVEVGYDVDQGAAFVDDLFLAGADLSGSQYLAVIHSTSVTNTVVLAGAGGLVLGILQNAPASGAVARVRLFGRTKWVGSGSIARGAALASDASGKAKAAVLGSVNTSDAGASADALVSSHACAISLAPVAADVAGDVFFNQMGAIPTTAS